MQKKKELFFFSQQYYFFLTLDTFNSPVTTIELSNQSSKTKKKGRIEERNKGIARRLIKNVHQWLIINVQLSRHLSYKAIKFG